jgi:hypothetical protein
MSKQKNYKNGFAIQKERNLGNFVTTPKSILLDKNLTDKAKVLFQLLVDTPSDSKISLEYYRNMLGWGGKDTMTNAFENLRLNGYARYEQHLKGKGNGYCYTFVLSEYANLKVEDKVELKEEPVTTETEIQLEDEAIITLDVESVKLTTEVIEKPNKTEEEIQREYEEALQILETQMKKVCEEKMQGGTIAQRKDTLKKMLEFWHAQINQGHVMTDDEVRSKVFILHHNSKTANRVIDQRYND